MTLKSHSWILLYPFVCILSFIDSFNFTVRNTLQILLQMFLKPWVDRLSWEARSHWLQIHPLLNMKIIESVQKKWQKPVVVNF